MTLGSGAWELSSVIVTDAEGRILFWSDGAERLYGWSAEEAVGRPVAEIFAGEPPRETDSPDAPLVLVPLARKGTAVLRRRDGSQLEIYVERVPLEVDGKVVAIVGESTPVRLRPLDAELALAQPAGGVRQVIEARMAWFQAFLASTRSAMSIRELDVVLEDVLPTVANSLDADAASLLVTDAAGGELIARAAYGWAAELTQPVRIPVGAGVSGRIFASSAPVVIVELDDVEVHSPHLRQSGFHSFVGVPLVENGQTVGVLHATSIAPGRFSFHDAEILSALAGPLASAVSRVGRLARMAEIANPAELPQAEGLGIHGRYQAADGGHSGGDWLDATILPDRSIAVTIGDVAGHDLDALVRAAGVRHALLAFIHQSPSPADALGSLQRLVRATTVAGINLVTAQVVVVEPRTGTLRLASAGHPPLLVASEAGGRFSPLGGPPISTSLPETTYTEHLLQLRAGDRAVLYTDGVVEAKGETLDEGLARLRAVAIAHRHLPLPEYVERLISSATPEPATDDRTVVALELSNS